MKKSDWYLRLIIPFIIIAIGCVYIWLTDLVIYRGDDLAYANGLKHYMAQTGHGAWRYPLSHILNVNSRFGDTFNYIFLDFLPRPLLNIICGLGISAFYYLILRLGWKEKRIGITGGICVIALITFTFQWWDVFLMLVVQINYIWGAVLNLLCIYIFGFKNLSKKYIICCLPLFFIAPAMHEACGLPIVLAAGIVLCIKKIHLRNLFKDTKRPLYISYVLGMLFPFVSPGFYRRLLSSDESFTPDDSPLSIFIKSDYYVLFAIAIFLIFAIINRSRIRYFLNSSPVFWIVAALISALISAASGVVGRSGWFAQCFALISILQLLTPIQFRLRKILAIPLSSALLLVMAFHFYGLIKWQTVYYELTKDILSQYRKNPEKPIYVDYTYFSDAPWWLLGKQLGMFDPTDEYAIETEQWVNSLKSHPMKILPLELKNQSSDTIKLPYFSSKGVVMNNELIRGGGVYKRSVGEQTVVIPFSYGKQNVLLIRKRDLRPGER